MAIFTKDLAHCRNRYLSPEGDVDLPVESPGGSALFLLSSDPYDIRGHRSGGIETLSKEGKQPVSCLSHENIIIKREFLVFYIYFWVQRSVACVACVACVAFGPGPRGGRHGGGGQLRRSHSCININIVHQNEVVISSSINIDKGLINTSIVLNTLTTK